MDVDSAVNKFVSSIREVLREFESNLNNALDIDSSLAPEEESVHVGDRRNDASLGLPTQCQPKGNNEPATDTLTAAIAEPGCVRKETHVSNAESTEYEIVPNNKTEIPTIKSTSSTVPSTPATVPSTPTTATSEDYVDVVPLEMLPVPPAPTCTPVYYTPSLDHSPSHGALQRDRPTAPNLLDRSFVFLRREFDNLRYTLGSRPVLTHCQWFNLFNADGQMLNSEDFYSYLLDYDWPAELLQDGWRYMFDFYETYSNYEERVLLEKYKSQDMEKLILQWSSLLADEEANFADRAKVEKLIYLINKDVPRTDRDHLFYASNAANSDVLRDLLVTFSFANPEIGYVQGMNDVLSLFLITIDDKVAAYWSFSNYILRNKLFFNSTGLMAKLNGVAELVNFYDSELYSKLKVLDCSNMLFCQRWILLGFKRECKSFEMAVRIFTMINSLKPTHNILLNGLGMCELLSLDMFLVVAILISARSTLINYTDQTDVYQWTGKLKLCDMSVVYHAKQMYDEWARKN